MRWEQYAAGLEPLEGRECVVCLAPAVLGTIDGFRCAGHPPAWGRSLSWGSRPAGSYCTLTRCYCGRCAHYAPHPAGRVAPEPTPLAREALAALRARNRDRRPL